MSHVSETFAINEAGINFVFSVVNYQGRTRRIYADLIGNAGTSYILVKGEKVFVR